MSLPLSNTFETALSDETAVTEVNSADGVAGNAFDLVQLGGASTIVYDTARAGHGVLSARFNEDAANGAFLLWDVSMGNQTTVYGRVYVYRTAAPTPNHHWVVIHQDTGTIAAAVLWNDSTQKLNVFDSTLASSAASVNNVPLNEWVRIEWKLVCSATVGIIEAKMFHADGTSAIDTVTLSACNTLTQTNELLLGQGAAANSGSAFWLDDLVVNNTGYPGPAATTPSTSTGGVRMMTLGVG